MVSNTPSTHPPSSASSVTLLAVTVGNTRARWGVFVGRELTPGGAATCEEAIDLLRQIAERTSPDTIALASVNDRAAAEIEAGLAGCGLPIVRVGRDVHPPLKHTLEDASTLGIDRVLNALAAFSLVESAVAVVDAGSAITVDFVDGEGTFHGGAIAPGCAMMLQALHEQTAALPDLAFDPAASDRESKEPFGRDTAHAMQLGVAAAARGLVRDIVEQFAVFYEAFPRVLGTGGDAAALFEADEFVERIIPDLQLIGVQRTIEAVVQEGDG